MAPLCCACAGPTAADLLQHPAPLGSLPPLPGYDDWVPVRGRRHLRRRELSIELHEMEQEAVGGQLQQQPAAAAAPAGPAEQTAGVQQLEAAAQQLQAAAANLGEQAPQVAQPSTRLLQTAAEGAAADAALLLRQAQQAVQIGGTTAATAAQHQLQALQRLTSEQLAHLQQAALWAQQQLASRRAASSQQASSAAPSTAEPEQQQRVQQAGQSLAQPTAPQLANLQQASVLLQARLQGMAQAVNALLRQTAANLNKTAPSKVRQVKLLQQQPQQASPQLRAPPQQGPPPRLQQQQVKQAAAQHTAPPPHAAAAGGAGLMQTALAVALAAAALAVLALRYLRTLRRQARARDPQQEIRWGSHLCACIYCCCLCVDSSCCGGLPGALATAQPCIQHTLPACHYLPVCMRACLQGGAAAGARGQAV
jgi:hypothetical protein